MASSKVIELPTSLVIPKTPGWTLDEDAPFLKFLQHGFICVKTSLGAVVAPEPAFHLQAAGVDIEPSYESINGFMTWGSGRVLWAGAGWDWIWWDAQPRQAVGIPTQADADAGAFYHGAFPSLPDGAAAWTKSDGSGETVEVRLSPNWGWALCESPNGWEGVYTGRGAWASEPDIVISATGACSAVGMFELGGLLG